MSLQKQLSVASAVLEVRGCNMALLTEEQINDILDITNVWESGIIVSNLIEWNEKQPSTQFEPDWDNTPSNATKVYLDAVWFNSDMKETDRITICGWDRPTTPHPHAEIMAKYAEVAARRVDPWVEFEVKFEYGNWDRCTKSISFSFDGIYRYIGDK